MIDRVDPVELESRKGFPLFIADGYEPHIVKDRHQLGPVEKIHSSVKGMHARDRTRACEGKRQIIDMAVDDVELVRAGKGVRELHAMKGRRIGHARILSRV